MSRLYTNMLNGNWQSAGRDNFDFLLQGAVFNGSRQTTYDSLADDLSNALDDLQQIKTLLDNYTGFYAMVVRKERRLFASVDRIRSIPLFYGQHNGRLYLSDNAEHVRQQVDSQEMDLLAREEFLLTGYVTGCDTLYPNVKQLQAGEYLIAEENDNGVSIQCHRYYRFLHSEPSHYNEQELRAQLESATENAINRLIKYADGRQIVLPLSGGYDSRLIAVMLKRLNYKNVLCFTYGIPGNKEAECSRRVAETLGYAWTFVQYSNEIWAEAWSTSKAEEYRRMASNHVSLPHIQDWLAIKILLERKEIHQDAVIVPGHSGDFVAGSHIPDFVFTKETHTQRDLLQALIKNHYSNSPKRGMALFETDLLEPRVSSCIGVPFDGTAVGLANLYETWDWQERQAKYIVNSVRVYDQFNLSWWLPLWDAEFMNFWQSVPLILRRGRNWYNGWVTEKYLSISTIPEKSLKEVSPDTSSVYKLAKRIFSYFPESISDRLRSLRNKNIYANHFLALGGLVNPDELNFHLGQGYNIIGVYSYFFLNDEWH